jgi:YD repeat-containing protein
MSGGQPSRSGGGYRLGAQPGRAAPLVLRRLAALLLALLALLAPAISSAHAGTAALAHLAASTHLAASATTPQRGTTPIPPGCAERSPASASASTALGGIDSASAPRARALAMGGRPHPAGGITRAQWDGEGNLNAVQQPDGGVWRFHYDILGRRLSATDPLGHATHYTYSPRGDLVAVRDALGQVVKRQQILTPLRQ